MFSKPRSNTATSTTTGTTKRSAFGWNCRNCTFHHSVPAPRCSMCGELRGASRQEMRDFVLGKKVPPVMEGNVVELLDSPASILKPNEASDAASNAKPEAAKNPPGTKTAVVTTPASASAPGNNASFFSKENRHNHKPPPSIPKPMGTKSAVVRNNPYSKASNGPRKQAIAANINTNNTNSASIRSAVRNPYSSGRPRSNTGQQIPQHQKQQQHQQQQVVTKEANAQDSSAPQSRQLQQPQHQPQQQPQQQSQNQPQHQQQQQLKPPPPQPQKQHSFFEKKVTTNVTTRRKRPPTQAKVHHFSFSEGPVRHIADAAQTYIYPKHPDFPTRDYQKEITETALNYNTLVSLPTGLGKTHIAAVVMYNFWRWFAPPSPSRSEEGGKIIFLAPTLPLVNQQIEACYNIMGIPGDETAVLTGRLKVAERRSLWKRKRLFFCTPQTVQKDLMAACCGDGGKYSSNNIEGAAGNHQRPDETQAPENQIDHETARAFSRVVCLVLDEAHKATGDYAYTKVVELLEQHAGAKFRILGLSATPGTSIKAIQGVIETLRSCKIEARTDTDDSVAPYLHQKRTEVIVCPRNTHQRAIGKKLSQIVEPLLQKLRDERLLSYGTAETLTAYSVFRAKQLYETNHRGQIQGGLLSMFHATHTLIQLKSDCHQGLGVVRTKLLRLKNNSQRGFLSKIVKSDAFRELWDQVSEATGGSVEEGPNPTTAIGDIVDPKLSKLCELLKHHFERTNADNHSSRAIVFAQFRDSVQEVVDCLERTLHPLVRSRYFVGQNKGGGSSSSNRKTSHNGSNTNPSDERVSGMKQAEQQRAIRDFRDNIFNVLVCTSIGEEGLDIGDVDLIINYDVIRSPIRTIQRAGRTGRKRDGRVVSLIAEGQEEQTHNKRVEGERTLANALKNPKKFVMASHHPMLPIAPALEYQTIQVRAKLNMKEVAGAQQRTPGVSKKAADAKNAWLLTFEQEDERQRFMGNGAVVCLPQDVTWKKLKRFFCKNRLDPSRFPPGHPPRRELLSPQERELLLQKRQKVRKQLLNEKSHNLLRGRDARILERIQQKHGPVHSVGTARKGYERILKLFPIHPVPESDEITKDTSVSSAVGISRNMWPKKKAVPPLVSSTIAPSRQLASSGIPIHTSNTAKTRKSTISAKQIVNCDASLSTPAATNLLPIENSNTANIALPANRLVNQKANKDSMSDDHSRQCAAVEETMCETETGTDNVVHNNQQDENVKLPESNAPPLSPQPKGVQNAVFRLPTPPPSSDSSCSEGEHVPQPVDASDRPSDPEKGKKALFRLQTPPPSSDSSSSDGKPGSESIDICGLPSHPEKSKKAIFRLPTPPPSSDSSSDEDGEEDSNDCNKHANPLHLQPVQKKDENVFHEIPKQIAFQAVVNDSIEETKQNLKMFEEEAVNDRHESALEAPSLEVQVEKENAIFRLPTPPPSSSSSSDEDGESGNDTEVEDIACFKSIRHFLPNRDSQNQADKHPGEHAKVESKKNHNPRKRIGHSDPTVVNLEDGRFRQLEKAQAEDALGTTPSTKRAKLFLGFDDKNDPALSSLKSKSSGLKEGDLWDLEKAAAEDELGTAPSTKKAKFFISFDDKNASSLKSKSSGMKKCDLRDLSMKSSNQGHLSLGFDSKDDLALSSLKSKSPNAKKMNENNACHTDRNKDGEDVTSVPFKNRKNNKKTPSGTPNGVTLKTARNDIILSSLREKDKRKECTDKVNVSFGSLRVQSERKNQALQNATEDTDSDNDMPLSCFRTKGFKVPDSTTPEREQASHDASNISNTPFVDKQGNFGTNSRISDTKIGTGRPSRPRILESPDSKATDYFKEGSAYSQSQSQNEIVNHLKPGKNRKRLRIGTDDSDEETDGRGMPGTTDDCESQNVTPSTPFHETSSSALQDTPPMAKQSGFNTSNNHKGGPESRKRNTSDFLTDTPTTTLADTAEDIVCQICASGDSRDEDLLVLCDGCNLGFHQHCYPVEVDVESTEPWYCDMCKYHSMTSPLLTISTSIGCTYCCKRGGDLRKDGATWYHPLCFAFSSKMTSASCCACSLVGAVLCNSCSSAVHPHCALDAGWTIVRTTATAALPMKYSIFCPKHKSSVGQASKEKCRIIRSEKSTDADNSQRPKQLKRRRAEASDCNEKAREMVFDINAAREKEIEILDDSDDDKETKKEKERLRERRRQGLARFVLEEAEIGSDQENDDDENEELVRLEEEEQAHSQDSFINDNPDLTQHFSQDILGDADPDAATTDFDYGAHRTHKEQVNDDPQNLHRVLDARRERENQFQTPNFNRRMMRSPNSASSFQTENGGSVPSSERGLGRMHFIRSVLEHHRQGGDCDQIEAEYKRMEATAIAQGNVDARQPASASTSMSTNSLNPLVDLLTPESNKASSPIQPTSCRRVPADNNSEATTNDSSVANHSNIHAESISLRTNEHAIAISHNSSSQRVGSSLTAEQLARIEANRQAALRRRAQFKAKN